MTHAYFCSRCGLQLDEDTVKFPYESDEPYCEECLGKLEVYWEGVYEDQNLDRFLETR